MRRKTLNQKVQPNRVATKYFSRGKTFVVRFKAAARDFSKLRRVALKQVKRWEYFSAPAIHLNPGHFFMEHDLGGEYFSVKQGRKLSGKPALTGTMVRHGVDNDGKLHVIQQIG